jgi:hypothetical protein
MEDYEKYKWFYTKSGKLVVGGKNATQNEELLKRLKKNGEELVIMHTREPGSPFTAILSDLRKVTQTDKEQCAIFTGCFSRAWRSKKKKTQVDVFKLSQLYKKKEMKIGTWGVKGKIEKKTVDLVLVLIKQKDTLRAVPELTAKSKKSIILKICPGTIDKKDFITKMQVEFTTPPTQQELLSALPAGGSKVLRI